MRKTFTGLGLARCCRRVWLSQLRNDSSNRSVRRRHRQDRRPAHRQRTIGRSERDPGQGGQPRDRTESTRPAAPPARSLRPSSSPIPARRTPPWTALRAPCRRMGRCSLLEWIHHQSSPALQAKLPALKVLMLEGDGQCRRADRQGVLTELFPGQRKRLDDHGFVPGVPEGSGHQEVGHHRGRLRGRARLRGQVQGLDCLARRVNRQDAVRPFGTPDFGAKISDLGQNRLTACS